MITLKSAKKIILTQTFKDKEDLLNWTTILQIRLSKTNKDKLIPVFFEKLSQMYPDHKISIHNLDLNFLKIKKYSLGSNNTLQNSLNFLRVCNKYAYVTDGYTAHLQPTNLADGWYFTHNNQLFVYPDQKFGTTLQYLIEQFDDYKNVGKARNWYKHINPYKYQNVSLLTNKEKITESTKLKLQVNHE